MPSRRSFLKDTLLTSTGFLLLPMLSFDEQPLTKTSLEELEKGFLNPPASARPLAYWMWMNGHITQKGITLDLERMRDMGLSGAFIFNTGTGTPRGPVIYGSEQWMEFVVHAMKEARRLGLELFLHNSPGFSSTGGVKVRPDLSMQQLVWTETVTESKGTIAIQLPQPKTRLCYYRDTVCIAYPTLGVEKHSMKTMLARVVLNGVEMDKNLVLDKESQTGIELEPAKNVKSFLQLEFTKPFEARAITITRQREPPSSVYDAAYDHPPSLALESSNDGQSYQPVCTIDMPLLRFMDAPGAQSFPAVKARYFRLVATRRTILTSVDLHSSPRLTNWPGKANFTDFVEREDDEKEIEKEFIIDPNKVIDITDKLLRDGQLTWDAPAGTWTILRFGHTCTGTRTVASPDGSDGLEIDKFSVDAVDAYFTLYLDRLIQRFKPYVSFKGLLVDSWEIGKQNWTATFPSFFQQKQGYSISAWMPALTGRVVHSISNTEKFLGDLRRTQAHMVAGNYYGRFQKKCSIHGLKFYAQPNGDGVFDSLQVGQHLDMPMSEFWRGYVPGTINLVKQAVSIAHGYGSKTVAAEAYTGIPAASRWTEYPYALKRQGDHMYSMGINRFVLHVFVHQPYTTGFPGMSMGAWGSHFDRNMTWHKGAKEWISYLSRTQYLLQQGLPVVDICYFKGEEPTSGIPDVNYVNPPVPKTLAGDVIGPDVLMNRVKIASGKIVLPDGMQYRLMILAPLKRISFEILHRLESLVEAGMILLVTERPIDTNGLSIQHKGAEEINQLTNTLWGDLDGIRIKERVVGKGKIYWNQALTDILQAHHISPDFEVVQQNSDAAIHYTHRRIGETDLYFISNHLRRRESLLCSFRVKGKYPEIWQPETGDFVRAALYSEEGDRIHIPLELSPSGSLFIIFRKPLDGRSFTSVYRNGDLLSSAKPSLRPGTSSQDITDNFTISLWIKPDIPSGHPKGVLIFPPEAGLIYGSGHTACGLSAGQNGVRVYEREKGPNHSARPVISVQKALAGWIHLALRYTNRQPSIFINGRLAGVGTASTNPVHPGLGTPPTDEIYSASFEGSFTQPELTNTSLTDDTIYQLFQKGLPLPEEPSPITPVLGLDGQLSTTIWEDGEYRIEGGSGTKAIKVTNCKTIIPGRPWQVFFPSSSGAPSITLKKLASLHEQAHFDIRHFSGTATWQTSFSFPERLSKEQVVMLHLGRVEVIAEVILNGKNLGILWKEPFSIDITNTLKAGNNILAVKVTNLWPNRMVGDAHLPTENNYDENGFITRFPNWYVNSQPKPGRRQTFSTWNNFTKDDPLQAAGLLGPVRLMIGWKKTVL